MAPPRRKSCDNCVKSKRRCDMTSPRCRRCASKDLACEYPNLSRSQDAEASLSMINKEGTPMFTNESNLTPEEFLLAIDNVDMEPHTDLSAYSSEQYTNWAQSSNVESIDLVHNDEDYITTGDLYYARSVFASDQLKAFPGMFYRTGKTPFIHRYSYEQHTPIIIQDALSSCALYCGKNKDNESLCFGDINRKVRQLIDSVQGTLQSPADLLATVQALLLYQIVRLLDGNIRQRANAESDETFLMLLTEQLSARVQPQSLYSVLESPSTSGDLIVSDWRSWIFSESVRRTVLTSYLLQGVYSFLKLGYDTVTGKINKMSFTARSSLWTASTEFDWYEALKVKDPLEGNVGQWDSILKPAPSTDLDELGVIIVALCGGMETLPEWLGSDNLVRYGLK